MKLQFLCQCFILVSWALNFTDQMFTYHRQRASAAQVVLFIVMSLFMGALFVGAGTFSLIPKLIEALRQ